jgi:hypothetical protein
MAVRKPLALFALIVLSFAARGVLADIETGLVGYWPLDETTGNTAVDQTLSGYDGTLAPGSASFDVGSVPGVVGNALHLDGANNERLDIANPAFPLPTDAFTIAFWVKPDNDMPNDGARTDFLYWRGGARPHISHARNGANLGIFYNAGGDAQLVGNLDTLAAQRWYHLAFTSDGTSISIYVDGDLDVSQPLSIPHEARSGPTFGSHTNGSNSFAGTMDEIRIYDRALPIGDIGELAGATFVCPYGAYARRDGGNVELLWANGETVPTSVTVARDGVDIATAVSAATETYTDTGITAPGLLAYTLTFDVPGETCAVLQAAYNGCITNLAVASTVSGLALSWQNNLPYAGIEIRRGDEILDASAAGDAESYPDDTVLPGIHTYSVNPTNGTCEAVTATYNGCITNLSAEAGVDTVTLTWNNNMTYDGIEITRNGEVIAAALDGTAETFTDDASPPEGMLRYTVVPTTGTCTPAVAYVNPNCTDGGPLCEDPVNDGATLEWAFAFGSRDLSTCETASEPGTTYTMVLQEGAAAAAATNLAYDDVRGWGYEAVYPAYAVDDTTPYGNRGGLEVFGPFDASANNRDAFDDDTCPDELYDSWIGCTYYTSDCYEDPCPVAEGLVFKVDIPNGTYRFVAASGSSTQQHVHRIVAEDGGSGPPDEIGNDHVVLVHNFQQSQWAVGEVNVNNPGRGAFARVGFNGRNPPLGDGIAPDPQFVNMDENGIETVGCPESPTLEVTQGYMRIHQLKGSTTAGCGGGRDANGGNLVILEIWKVEGGVVTEGFKRGDSNRDGGVNIADAVYILQRLFAGGDPILCLEAADSNDDDGVNIADAVYILQRLFAGGEPIPPPGPDTCGPDTTLQPGKTDLGCEDYDAQACAAR